MRRHGLGGSANVVLAASLAKGFGVPMTVLAGRAATIARFDCESETRLHCSPPSIADLTAARQAIDINRHSGDGLRLELTRRVHRFREGVRRLGISTGRTLFPVQRLDLPKPADALTVHRRLHRMGVRAVLQRPTCRPGPAITFLITVRHSAAVIDRGVEAIGVALEIEPGRRRHPARVLAQGRP